MSPRPTPKVGDTLYSLNVGNAARHRPQVLTTVQVVKVGRKYFECSLPEYATHPHMATVYHLDDWREKTDYCLDSRLYASPQEYEDETCTGKIREEMRLIFSSEMSQQTIPLEKLREIQAIVRSCEKPPVS